MPQTDNHLMRHLLIGILVSYRHFRLKLEFHGNINQTSVVGVENEKMDLYPNNIRGKYYQMYQRQAYENQKEKDNKIYDLYDFKYRLIYHHANMITVKEWLGFRIRSLKRGAR